VKLPQVMAEDLYFALDKWLFCFLWWHHPDSKTVKMLSCSSCDGKHIMIISILFIGLEHHH